MDQLRQPEKKGEDQVKEREGQVKEREGEGREGQVRRGRVRVKGVEVFCCRVHLPLQTMQLCCNVVAVQLQLPQLLAKQHVTVT